MGCFRVVVVVRLSLLVSLTVIDFLVVMLVFLVDVWGFLVVVVVLEDVFF